jgi:hypothetical protein
LRAIEGRHVRVEDRVGPGSFYKCREDHQGWPCDAARLLAALEARPSLKGDAT